MIIDDELKMGFTSIERELDYYIEINGFKYSSIDLLKDLKVNIKADKDGIWIGRAIPKMLNAEIINNGDVINAGDEIKPYFGVKIGDSYKYINVGTFYAQTPELTEDRKIIKVAAYDKFKKAQTLKYGDISYPTTINNIVDLIASKLEVQVDKTNLMFLDYTIEKEIFFGKDKTVIELINAIAHMSICFAYLDYDNILKFKRPERVVTSLSANNVFKARIKNYQDNYDAVVISRQPQNDDVVQKMSQYQVNSVEVKLSNNPILDLDREFFANYLLGTAIGIPPHYGLEILEMQSNPLLEIGDLVFWGNKAVLVLEHEITMSRSVLKSQIAEKTETDFKKAKGIENLAINTELYVDKVKNEIVASIGDEVGNKITELKLDEKGIAQRVKTVIEENKDELKGDTGPQGPRGSQGQRGIQGLNGKDGKDGQDAEFNLVSLINQEKGYHLYGGNTRTNAFKHNTSSYIPIKPSELYTLSKDTSRVTSDQYLRYAFYDSNKRYISQSQTDMDLFSITTPSNAIFMRISYPDDSKPMLEIGEKKERDYYPNPKDTVAISEFEAYQTITNEGIAQKVSLSTYNSNNNKIDTRFAETKLYIDDKISTYKVTADNIKLEGYTTINGGFKVDNRGNVIATSGQIGSWNISDNFLWSGSGSNYVRFSGADGYAPFLAGGDSWDSAPFAVSSDGLIKATNAHVSGTINAKSGTIGGFNIDNNTLYAGSGSSYVRISGASGYTTILAGGSDWNSAKFAVSSTGTLKAEGANISGTITAKSGSIGNWNINDNGIYRSGNGYYVHIMPTNNYPIFFGTDSNNSRFRVTQTGTVLARAFTLEGGKVGGTNVYSSYMSGGRWSSANGSGSFSGSASFSSGSYTGSGYLYSGSTLAGYSLSDSNGYLTLSNLYVSSRFSTRNFDLGSGRIQGVYHSGAGGYMYASLGTTGWTITNSDIRLKENVKTMGDDTVKEIYSLPLIEYNYKSDETKVLNYGVNANLLSKILPEKFAKSFIFKDKNSGLYGAKYEMLTPHLVKAVQDLNKRLERLENE